MTNEINTARVLAFIKSHGVYAVESNGKIMVEDAYTKDGVLHTPLVYIEPTMKAAREFLNY